MGCIARLGCLVMLALLAIGGWLTRDQWLPKLTGHPSTTASVSSWQPLSPEAGARGKKKIDELSSATGPVFSNLTASEVASYVFQTVARTIPASADSAEAAVIGDALYVLSLIH